MTQEYYFHNAKWVGAENRTRESFSVIRGYFETQTNDKVTLNVLGLGFFKCYINGVCINPDTFLPLSSDFEGTCDPVDEVISAHRIYVPQFDVTPFVKEGKTALQFTSAAVGTPLKTVLSVCRKQFTVLLPKTVILSAVLFPTKTVLSVKALSEDIISHTVKNTIFRISAIALLLILMILRGKMRL